MSTTSFDIPIGPTSHRTSPLGMLARTSPPAKATTNPTTLAAKMHRASTSRRSALDRAVSFARSHLTSVQEAVRRKSMQDTESRQALAGKLRAKLLACEARRSVELECRRSRQGSSGSGAGVTRTRSTSSASSISSTSSTEEEALDELADVVARFAALDLVQHDASSRTLDDLVAHIEDARTVDVTRELLNAIALVAATYPANGGRRRRRRRQAHGRAAGRKRSQESLKSQGGSSSSSTPSSPASDEGVLLDNANDDMAAPLLESNPFDTRTFLAAMATSLFPSQVLRPDNPMDDMLFGKTADMIDTFARLVSHPTLRRVHAFVSAWTRYATQFAEWKLASQQTLIHELIAHFLDVDRLWQEARPRFISQPPSAPLLQSAIEYVQGLRNRQQMILNRLERFGGHEAKEALARSRQGAGFDLVTDELADLLGPTLGGMVNKTKGRAKSVLRTADSASDLVDQEALAKNEQAQQFLRNVQAAHDLYLDGVRLGENHDGETSQEEKQVERTLKRAFRIQKQAMFRHGELAPWLVDCLQLLCQTIANATPNPPQTIAALTHMCDLDWISARVAQSTYTSSDLAQVLADLTQYMRTQCAPARDPLLAPHPPEAAAPSDDVVAHLFHLLDTAQLMRHDFARARTAAILPDLARVIVPLERKHFASLGHATQGLPRTKQWLASAMESASGAPAATAGGAVYRHVWDSAVIHLVLSPPLPAASSSASSAALLPETWFLDTARLTRFSDQIHALVLAATLVTHARTRVPTDIGHGPLVALVHAGHTRDAVDLVLTTLRGAGAGAGASRKHLIESLVQGATGLAMSRIVAACVSKSDPVYKVLVRRVEADLRAALAAAVDDLGGDAHGAGVSKALGVVGDALGEVLGKVVRMAQLNRVVYAEWYDRALDEVVGELRGKRQLALEEDLMAREE